MAEPKKSMFNLTAITTALRGKITSFKTGSISFLNHISTKVSNIKNYFYKPKVNVDIAEATTRQKALAQALAQQKEISKTLVDPENQKADEFSGFQIEQRSNANAVADLEKVNADLAKENVRLAAELSTAHVRIAKLNHDLGNQTTSTTVNRLTDKAAELRETLARKDALLKTYEKSFAVCRVQLFRLNETTVQYFEATATFDTTLAKLITAEINGMHNIAQLRDKIYATNKTIQDLENQIALSSPINNKVGLISVAKMTKAEVTYSEIKNYETLVKVYIDELRNAYVAQNARTVSMQKVMSERLAETQASTLIINEESLSLYKELTKILASNEELAQLKQLTPPRTQGDLEQQFKRLLDEVLRPTESKDHYGRPKSPDELKPNSTTKSTLHSAVAYRAQSESSPLNKLLPAAPYIAKTNNLTGLGLASRKINYLGNLSNTMQLNNTPSTTNKPNPPLPKVPSKHNFELPFPDVPNSP